MSGPEADKDAVSAPPTSLWDNVVSHLPSVVRDTMDRQRLERLQQCRQLEKVLKACRANKPQRRQLEDFPLGIRSVRYFAWRRLPGDKDDDRFQDTSCLREEHALWACRGVALKCGAPLVQLRDCFAQYTAAELLSNQTTTNNNTTTAYQKTNQNDDNASHASPPPLCAAYQQALGTCVAHNAAALAQRVNETKSKAQQQQQQPTSK